MSLLQKVREAINPGTRRWPDRPWLKPLPLKRQEDGRFPYLIVEARDLVTRPAQCPLCGHGATLIEQWIFRLEGNENASWSDRWPSMKAYKCEKCGEWREPFTDIETDRGYQRAEGKA